MRKKTEFAGKWNITRMSGWDADYCNMEVQAFIRFERGDSGEFQFGLVCGWMDGEYKDTAEGTIFDFTWEGSDECDEASGDGWMKINKDGTGEGEIRIHDGDGSRFWAKKVAKQVKRGG